MFGASTTDNNQLSGVTFPLTDEDQRSTTITGKCILAAALEVIDNDSAVAVQAQSNWRNNYLGHFRRLVELSLVSDIAPEMMANAGLTEAYQRFQFIRHGESMLRSEAMSTSSEKQFFTGELSGVGGADRPKLIIPYHGELLQDDSLLRKIEEWETAGIIEPSHGEALRRLQKNPDWLDLSDQTIVLLGAGAEMGPLEVLSQWRANIVAVDLARPAVWKRLIGIVRQGNGKLYAPLNHPAEDESGILAFAGANLLTETPEIAQWLKSFAGPLTIGGYAYLDGQLHVQVSMAMDAIMQTVTAERPDVALAFLPTPTDVFAISPAAADMAQSRFEERRLAKLWQAPLRALSGQRFFEPNIDQRYTLPDGREVGITDNLVLQQGPNYALAKRLQQWRALVSRAQGISVSVNVAPSTTTRSVVKNLALAAAYAGADWFGVEVFNPETSNALMAAMLVHDLRYEKSAANPAVQLGHPSELFMEGANHGGLWRVGFASRSVMEIAALLGWRGALAAR